MIICPNLKNPEVAREFEELKLATSEQAAYHIWSLNNGNAIDKAPNGAESKLFLTLLKHYGDDRVKAILAKAKVYGTGFLLWFGDWTGNYEESLDSDGVTKTVQDNGKIRLSLDTHTEEHPRLIVLEPQGDNKYYVHIRIWDGEKVPGEISDSDKHKLFNALYKELPTGAEILFPKSGEDYYGTRGTVAGLMRLERDKRFSKGQEGVLLYKDKDGSVKEYKGTSFIKVDMKSTSKVVDENGEPLMVYHGGARNINAFKLPNNKAKISFDNIRNLEWAKKEGYVISEEDLVRYNNGEDVEVTKPVGIYFAADEVVSRSYFGRRNIEDDKLYAIFLNIKNPYITNKEGKQMFDDTSTVLDLQKAKDNNQDGVIIENIRDYGPNDWERMNWETNEFADRPTTDYVVFTPNQIKSATDNNGMFSRENDDILLHIKKSEIPTIKLLILKKNPKLTQDAINSAIEFLDELENNPELNLYVKYCIKWLKNNTIRIPEDNETVLASFKLARLYGFDLQQFKSPFDLIQAVLNKKYKEREAVDPKPVDPTKIKEFTFAERVVNDEGETIDVYDVQDDDAGRLAVSLVIADTSPKGKNNEWILGEFTSPWCLATFNYDKNTGKVTRTSSSDNFWQTYNADKRQIAFLNGFPIAFRSSSFGTQWWSYEDSPYEDVRKVPSSCRDFIFTRRKETANNEYQHFELNGTQYRFLGNKLDLQRRRISVDVDDTLFNFDVYRRRLTFDNRYTDWSSYLDIYFDSLDSFDRMHILQLVNNSRFVFARFSNYIDIGKVSMHDGIRHNGEYIPIEVERKIDENVINELNSSLDKINRYWEENNLSEVIRLGNVLDFDDIVKNEIFINNLNKIKSHFLYIEKLYNDAHEELYKKRRQEFIKLRKKASESANQREAARLNARNKLNTEAEITYGNRQHITTKDHEYEIEPDDEEILQQIEGDDLFRVLYDKYSKENVIPELLNILRSILTEYHIEYVYDDLSEVFGDDVLGAFDILDKIIYISNNKTLNAITEVEEFSHGFIELMGSAYHKVENRDKYPITMVYSQLRDEVEKTTIYKQTYEEYKDVPYYLREDGSVDTAKIKKEALGKALAAAIIDNYKQKLEINKEDAGFLRKLLNWFKRVIDWFNLKLTKAGIKKIKATINNVAKSILDDTYRKQFIEHISTRGLKHVEYEETIASAPEEAKHIMRSAVRHGALITGSLSVRKQSPVFRKKMDKMHDIDIMVPSEISAPFFAMHPRFRQIYKVPEQHRLTNEQLVHDILSTPFMQQVVDDIPNLHVMYAYSDFEANLVVNAIVCDDPSLVEKFESLSGNFNSRLKQFSKKDREKIYLVDFFFNRTDKHKYINESIEDEENELKLASHKASFNAKLKYGRAKDVFDYQRLNPSNRVYKTATPNVLLNKELTNETDKTKESLKQLGAELMKKCGG